MLKSALLFAVAGLLIVMLAPELLPLLQPSPETLQPLAARAAIADAPVRQNSDADEREVEIPDNGANQYVLDALVEGQPTRFLVDTGANIVSLNAETARRLGFSDAPDRPHYTVNTANGRSVAYGVKLRSLAVGSIYMPDVEAIVSPNLGETNLLGMNFLKRLSKVEQKYGKLVLKP